MDTDLEVLLKRMLDETYAESVDGDVTEYDKVFGIILVPPPGDSFRVQLEEEFFFFYGYHDARSAKVRPPALGPGGYYFVTLSDQGIVKYDGPHQDSEPVRLQFEEAAAAYSLWWVGANTE